MRMLWRMTKVFILFTACTLFFYYGMMWINDEYREIHRYDEPEGTAIKVNGEIDSSYDWMERLLLFYQEGE
ncbi:YqzK family protein [Mangrovibacillus cuniculi]|uniref:YqzK family protein n=1 Tax=Mangrovibacillus cuniculi TaxID=2593652 RepID=A0A7S8HH84_9BACI|nr:YqzK family protein [Mangrovibacillus cuniculi]QPC48396.1 YqzK family protein [Mangrovibacillus cuniculi]